MNPALKSMFFLMAKTQFEKIARDAMEKKYDKQKKTNPKAVLFDCGKLKQISFVVEKNKTTQKMKFEFYEGEEELTEEEKQKFSEMVGIKIEEEEKKLNNKGFPIKDIICILDFDKKIINIYHTYTDNSIIKTTL